MDQTSAQSSCLTVCCLPSQAVRGTDKLHVPGSLEDGLLLAQPGSGPLLHADSPGLLSRLRPHRPPPPRPTRRHPGSVHRRARAGHAPYHRRGGVEE